MSDDVTPTPPPAPKGLPLAMRIVAALAAMTGLAMSGALLAPYLVHRSFCGQAGGCRQVAASDYAVLFGIPRAGIGLFAFSVALVFVVLGGARVRRLAPVVGLFAAAEGVHLLVVQATVLHAWCQFCVVADISALVLAAALVVEAIVTRRQSAPRPMLFPAAISIAGLVAGIAPIAVAAAVPPSINTAMLGGAVPRTADGKLVVREFVDLECPFCRATHVALTKALAGRTDVVVERHYVPFIPAHTHARESAVAACCAAEQSAEDKFVDGVVAKQEAPNEVTCRVVALELGLDMPKYDACRTSPRPQARITKDLALAEATGVQALPTIDCESERHVGALNEQDARAFLARHGAN